MPITLEGCPQAAKHNDADVWGHYSWSETVQIKLRSMRQRRCPGCGLFRIWVRHRRWKAPRAWRLRAQIREQADHDPVLFGLHR